MKSVVVLLITLFCLSSFAVQVEDCRAHLVAWWSSSSWATQFTNEIVPFIVRVHLEKNPTKRPLTISEKISLIESAHKQYLENSASSLPDETKAEFLKGHGDSIPTYMMIALIKNVFPDTSQDDLYRLAGFSPPPWKYEFADIIPFINAVAHEKNSENKGLTIFEKIGIIDIGHKRYIESYSATLPDDAKTSFLAAHDKRLTIFTQIHLMKLAFPETRTEDIKQLEKAAVTRANAYIIDLK
jgi:hypothetical protein